MKTNKDIWTLSANYLSGEMSETEGKAFETYLRKNRTAQEEFRKIKISWDYLGDKTPTDTKMAWEKLHRRLEEDNLTETSDSGNFIIFNPLYRVAAVIVFLVIFSFGLWFILSDNNLPPKGYYAFTSPENAASFTFPEGSTVMLNKDAVVYYSKDFNLNRKVKLKGEGFFEVMSDPENPFKIETEKGMINVIGTRFNVKENREEKTTEVFVESGKVRLLASESSKGIILEMGEFGKSNGNFESKMDHYNMNLLAWKTHEFEFIDQNLGTILDVLQKSYHVEIILKDNEIKNLKLTSAYSQQSIDAIIKTISVAFDLEYKLEKGRYIISMK